MLAQLKDGRYNTINKVLKINISREPVLYVRASERAREKLQITKIFMRVTE